MSPVNALLNGERKSRPLSGLMRQASLRIKNALTSRFFSNVYITNIRLWRYYRWYFDARTRWCRDSHLLMLPDHFRNLRKVIAFRNENNLLLNFRMTEAIANNIVKFLEHYVFLVYAAPQFIICDNGSQLAVKTSRK